MHNYIAVARKQDLADLVNYGEILIPLYTFIPYNGEFEALRQNHEVCREALEHVNAFKYTSSYVVLDVESEDSLDGADEYRLQIDQVRRVAPLDRSGKMDMDISWGAGFKFSSPLWDVCVKDVIVEKTSRLARLGAHDMWDIFDIKEDIKVFDDKLDDAFVRQFYRCVLDGVGHDELVKFGMPKDPSETERLLCLYILRYERHQPWPGEKIGYVYDAVNVFHNWWALRDLGEGVRDSPIIALLDSVHKQDRNAKFAVALRRLKEQAKTAKDSDDKFSVIINWLGDNGYLGAMVVFFFLKALYIGKGNELSKVKGAVDSLLKSADSYAKESDGLITAHSIHLAIYFLGLTITREGTGTEWYIKKGVSWIVPKDEARPESEPRQKRITYVSEANAEPARAQKAKPAEKVGMKPTSPLPSGTTIEGKVLKTICSALGKKDDGELKADIWSRLQGAADEQSIGQTLDDIFRESGKAGGCDAKLKANVSGQLLKKAKKKKTKDKAMTAVKDGRRGEQAVMEFDESGSSVEAAVPPYATQAAGQDAPVNVNPAPAGAILVAEPSPVTAERGQESASEKQQAEDGTPKTE